MLFLKSQRNKLPQGSSFVFFFHSKFFQTSSMCLLYFNYLFHDFLPHQTWNIWKTVTILCSFLYLPKLSQAKACHAAAIDTDWMNGWKFLIGKKRIIPRDIKYKLELISHVKTEISLCSVCLQAWSLIYKGSPSYLITINQVYSGGLGQYWIFYILSITLKYNLRKTGVIIPSLNTKGWDKSPGLSSYQNREYSHWNVAFCWSL